MVSIEDRTFAIQTIYNKDEQRHEIAFFEVNACQGKLEKLADHVVRQTEDKVKSWLTDKLVSFKIVGCRVYFFTFKKIVDKGNDKRSAAEVEDGGVADDRGLAND